VKFYRCDHVQRGRAPGVALYTHRPSGHVGELCRHCLDLYLDTADDSGNEPYELRWLPTPTRTLRHGGAPMIRR
jgi:hypothetical protein